MNKNIKKTVLNLAKADTVFWLMPALMVLLITGTLAQSWVGLYQAQKTFFSSFIFFTPYIPVPLPGGYTLLSLLSISLTFKFLLKSQWSWHKSGINLIHFGALTLLIGGLLTAIFAHESYMVIPEGNQSAFTYDYHRHEFLIYKNDLEIINIPFKKLPNTQIAGLPFTINIEETCTNCAISRRPPNPDTSPEIPYQAMAQFMKFTPKAPEKNPEENISGVTFTIKMPTEDKDTKQSGLYVAFTGMPKPITLDIETDTYRIVFGKAQTTLPFTITLQDFVKDSYAGTTKARSYHSDVIITDGAISWPVRIGMNAPLRYKGYTIFQSSFQQTKDTEMTVLAVVKNKGWVFPYIGALIIGAGLIIHLALSLYKRPNKQKKKS